MVLVLAATVAALLVLGIKAGQIRTLASRDALSYTPQPLPDVEQSSVVVVGDVSGLASALASWKSIVSRGLDMDLRLRSVAGAGYTTAAVEDRPSIVNQAQQIPSNADVVVLAGGAADSSSSQVDIAGAAGRAIAFAESAAPHARILLLPPAMPAGSKTALGRVRDALQAAALAGGVTLVEPAATNDAQSAYQADGVHLTKSGAQQVADGLRSALKKAIG